MKKLLLIFSVVILIFLFPDCAKMGSLSGGDKDSLPPVILNSNPDNYSLGFNKTTIEITFDEFIVLNNINQELVVSPPLKERITTIMKGKSLIINLNNDLKENTTYTLNFGQAIKDNNEGNVLSNYEFVFSTGDYLDSLSVYGRLLNAFDLKPSKDPVNIMLYDTLYDSAFIKEIPIYIAKTDKEGYFSLNNLKSDTFRIFALKDGNANYRFDLPNEEIAFLDTLMFLSPEFFSRIEVDTTSSDSIMILTPDNLGTALIDSSGMRMDSLLLDKILVDLYLFTEENQIQFLKDVERKTRERLFISFNRPVTDSFRIRSLVPSSEGWYIMQESMNSDSFNLWINDTAIVNTDSIKVELNYTIKDSVDNPVIQTDTLNFVYREVVRPTRRREQVVEEKFRSIGLSTIKSRAVLELNTDVYFNADFPFAGYDTSQIDFFTIVDSLEVQKDFEIINDSINPQQLRFRASWEDNTFYHLQVYPGAFTDIYGQTNDTLDVTFKTREKDYYGVLYINITDVSSTIVVELRDNKDVVIQKKIVDSDGKYNFQYLKPGNYSLKFIYDSNGNGKWNTGKYIQGIQPEKVEFYKGEIVIRSNWDLEVNHQLGR